LTRHRIEDYYNTGEDMWRKGERSSEMEVERVKFASFEAFRLSKGWTIHRVEWIIYDEEHLVGGMVDALFRNPQGQYVVVDWKRCKEIKMKNPWEKATFGPAKGMDSCNYSKYSLQISLYAYILRTKYGMDIASEGYIVSIHPNYESFLSFKVSVDWDRSRDILLHAMSPGTKARIEGKENAKIEERKELEELERISMDDASFEPPPAPPEPEPEPEPEFAKENGKAGPRERTDAFANMFKQAPTPILFSSGLASVAKPTPPSRKTKRDHVYSIYTDGSCSPNPGSGGWAFVVVDPDSEAAFGDAPIHVRRGASPNSTNNIMELTAAIEAVKYATDRSLTAEIVTDSMYVQKGITKWIHRWKLNGWKTKRKGGGGRRRNEDLWKELDRISTSDITWRWTKGHAGDKWNELADREANAARTSPSPSRKTKRDDGSEEESEPRKSRRLSNDALEQQGVKAKQ
jgi:ribonuclease HI